MSTGQAARGTNTMNPSGYIECAPIHAKDNGGMTTPRRVLILGAAADTRVEARAR